MSQAQPTPEELRAAKQAISAYQDSLSRSKFEQETHRDKTLVLISGGALTASFAFIATFVEHHQIVRFLWLELAWSAWTAVLILTVIGYTLSLWVYNKVIAAVSSADWGAVRNPAKASRLIEPLNIIVAVLAICGFASFGYFAIGNLARFSNEQGQAHAPPTNCGKEERDREEEGKENEQRSSGARLGEFASTYSDQFSKETAQG